LDLWNERVLTMVQESHHLIFGWLTGFKQSSVASPKLALEMRTLKYLKSKKTEGDVRGYWIYK
jgi:hypothetical protein